MTLPLISIIMPVYNSEAYLQDAIDSILDQTYTNIELLLLDDGSTDQSIEIIQKSVLRDRRIRALYLDHRGLVPTLNHGIAEAKADIVARMDSDDIALPDRIEQQVQYLLRHPQIVAVGTSIQIYVQNQGLMPGSTTPPSAPEAVLRELPKGCCIAHPTVMFKRQAILDAGGYKETYMPAEDYELWLRLLARHPNGISNLPQTLLHYRVHDSQISSQRLFDQILHTQAAMLAYDMYKSGLPDPFANDSNITYQKITTLVSNTSHLDQRIIAGYCIRLAQLHAWGFTIENMQPLYKHFWLFADDHKLRAYARARLALAMACLPSQSLFRKGSHMCRMMLFAFASPTYFSEFTKKLIHHLTSRYQQICW